MAYTRRHFLTDVAAGAAALALSPAAIAAPATVTRRRIDVHYHLLAPPYYKDEAIWKIVQPTLGNLPPEQRNAAINWSPSMALEEMDKNQIETIVSSIPIPGVWLGDVAQGRRLARLFNDYAAQLRRDHPGRFGLFAPVPLPDIEGSLAEIAYAFDQLGADGIGLFSSYDNKWLGDPAFAPVMEELNRRHAVVFVHPAQPICCRNLMPGIPPVLIEYAMDTLRGIMSLLLTGTAARFPNIRFIFCHSGGLLLGATGRLDAVKDNMAVTREHLPNGLFPELAKFYYECSNTADDLTLRHLRSIVPTSHILFGTDSPYTSANVTTSRFVANHLNAKDRVAIERANAVALMPGLKHR
jgi:predicted TIM-barrel fold metal-dependent hydrolase